MSGPTFANTVLATDLRDDDVILISAFGLDTVYRVLTIEKVLDGAALRLWCTDGDSYDALILDTMLGVQRLDGDLFENSLLTRIDG